MSEIEKHISIIERMMFAFATSTVDKKPIFPTLKYCKEALKEKLEQENPKPLTLEELHGMDGEPVYTVRGIHLPCQNDEWWAIIHTFPNCEFASFIAHGKEFSADFQDYGVRWLAYRHKPKHIGEAADMKGE